MFRPDEPRPRGSPLPVGDDSVVVELVAKIIKSLLGRIADTFRGIGSIIGGLFHMVAGVAFTTGRDDDGRQGERACQKAGQGKMSQRGTTEKMSHGVFVSWK